MDINRGLLEALRMLWKITGPNLHAHSHSHSLILAGIIEGMTQILHLITYRTPRAGIGVFFD